MTRSALLRVLALLPSVAVAQAAPCLEPLPIVNSLTELGVRPEVRSNSLLYITDGVVLFDSDAAHVVCIDPSSGTTGRVGRRGRSAGGITARRLPESESSSFMGGSCTNADGSSGH